VTGRVGTEKGEESYEKDERCVRTRQVVTQPESDYGDIPTGLCSYGITRKTAEMEL